jgi:hypothetical protein
MGGTQGARAPGWGGLRQAGVSRDVQSTILAVQSLGWPVKGQGGEGDHITGRGKEQQSMRARHGSPAAGPGLQRQQFEHSSRQQKNLDTLFELKYPHCSFISSLVRLPQRGNQARAI